MLTRLKLLIKLKIAQIKMYLYNKRIRTLQNKTSRLRTKYHKVSMDFYYMKERLYPEETWEMRAEREFRRLNL